MKVIERVTITEIHRVAPGVMTTGPRSYPTGTLYKRLPEYEYHHVTQGFNESDPNIFLKWVHALIGNAKACITSLTMV
jgi:hypothetical protein